jgi:hypothetical protein
MREPKLGQRIAGIVTKVEKGGFYWSFWSPSFDGWDRQSGTVGHTDKGHLPITDSTKHLKFYENQVLIFEWKPWPTGISNCYWQPVVGVSNEET